jgi:hypothetical protein
MVGLFCFVLFLRQGLANVAQAGVELFFFLLFICAYNVWVGFALLILLPQSN